MEPMTMLVIVYLGSSLILSYHSLRYETLRGELADYLRTNYPDYYKDIAKSFMGMKNGPGSVIAERIRRRSFTLPKDKFLDLKYAEFYRRERYIYVCSVLFVLAFAIQYGISRFTSDGGFFWW